MIPFNHLGWFFNLFGSAIYPRTIVAELYRALEPVSEGASVLDLGAGTGILSSYAHKHRNDLRFVAADPAEGMLKYAPGHAETVVTRAEALPFDDNAFEAVLIGEAVHHFDDPHAALHEISRAMKSGGMLFVYDFDPSTFLGKLVCLAEKLLGEPANFFAPEALKEILEAHGFTVQISRHGWRYTLVARLAS